VLRRVRRGKGQQPKEKSITALLEIVERIVEDEQARGASLTSKTTTLAGFSGTILSVVAVLGRELFKLDLGAAGDPAVRVLFVISVVALATAATHAIGGVLRPQPRQFVAIEQVQELAAPPWISMDPTEIKGNMLTTLGTSLESQRSLNDSRARLADHAAGALLVGLLALAAQALVLAVDELAY